MWQKDELVARRVGVGEARAGSLRRWARARWNSAVDPSSSAIEVQTLEDWWRESMQYHLIRRFVILAILLGLAVALPS